MVIEIEYYEYDTLLYGTKISFSEFKNQVNNIEKLYDRTEDNFVALLCRMYNWKVIKDEAKPKYVYDRDIKRCIELH